MACKFTFHQEDLYGDEMERISEFLNLVIDMERKEEFTRFLLQHIDSTFKEKKIQLPTLGQEYKWLNSERPLSLGSDLGKKVYVINFFTYCCINCIHIFPYLKEVENKHATNPSFAVIGIHSPKFDNERNLQQVKAAVLKNDIKHPVLNDPHNILWKTFSIVCWPTVFIVGPDNVLLFVLIGETQIEKLSYLCDLVLKYFESSSVELSPPFLPISQLKVKEVFTGLLYPGNVSTDGEKILVSDTGHNRLVLLSEFLEEKEIIGSGVKGYSDGSFETASFNSPHGTAWKGHCVYVADTGNHSIRKVCFDSKTVSTVFDRRHISLDFDTSFSSAKFCSPWDVCFGNLGRVKRDLHVLYVAVAGSHQIWAFNEQWSDACIPFAGSGKEENRPNRLRFKSGFAQPSGITYSKTFMPDNLFVADSESSTIKSIELFDGAVTNIVGGGLDPTDLFQFGDKDGEGQEVRLQHPMSICVLDKRTLIIADTYNHRIKHVDMKNRTCYSIKTKEGLNEPSGICIFKDSLLIADTNNHRIVTIPLNEIFFHSNV